MVFNCIMQCSENHCEQKRGEKSGARAKGARARDLRLRLVRQVNFIYCEVQDMEAGEVGRARDREVRTVV